MTPSASPLFPPARPTKKVKCGEIEGYVFIDVNGDGFFKKKDGDLPVKGVAVRLRDGKKGDRIGKTETDKDGSYYFDCEDVPELEHDEKYSLDVSLSDNKLQNLNIIGVTIKPMGGNKKTRNSAKIEGDKAMITQAQAEDSYRHNFGFVKWGV